ncbi:uncharacterized protein LOC100202539 isoform X2 [Hydra vulgaris]|uniref:uncharacterized protein LOC100202539 isoform X2 n=1 Tax=Hydra vulgaris TaxID=6087 RepID=UPI001F5FD361|nr:uncharacterized protein LOC100202539 isoform X2 [Hydra vulgaris]
MQAADLDDSLGKRSREAKDLPADILAELSYILNPPLIGKDFRSLAEQMNQSFQVICWLEMQKNPTASLLELWWSGSRTVDDLIVLLEKIHCFDAVKLLEPYRYIDEVYDDVSVYDQVAGPAGTKRFECNFSELGDDSKDDYVEYEVISTQIAGPAGINRFECNTNKLGNDNEKVYDNDQVAGSAGTKRFECNFSELAEIYDDVSSYDLCYQKTFASPNKTIKIMGNVAQSFSDKSQLVPPGFCERNNIWLGNVAPPIYGKSLPVPPPRTSIGFCKKTKESMGSMAQSIYDKCLPGDDSEDDYDEYEPLSNAPDLPPKITSKKEPLSNAPGRPPKKFSVLSVLHQRWKNVAKSCSYSLKTNNQEHRKIFMKDFYKSKSTITDDIKALIDEQGWEILINDEKTPHEVKYEKYFVDCFANSQRKMWKVVISKNILTKDEISLMIKCSTNVCDAVFYCAFEMDGWKPQEKIEWLTIDINTSLIPNKDFKKFYPWISVCEGLTLILHDDTDYIDEIYRYIQDQSNLHNFLIDYRGKIFVTSNN